jgi:hypothetical protein
MRHLSIVIAAVAVTAIVALAAACGGDDSPAPSTATSVAPLVTSPDKYVDDVCSAAARMFAAYKKNFNDNLASFTGMDPTDAYIKTAKAPFAVLITDLEKLSPPSAAAAAHQDTIRQAKDLLDAFNKGDRQKILALKGTPDTGKWKQAVELAPDLKTRFGAASGLVKSCQDLEKAGGGNPFQ